MNAKNFLQKEAQRLGFLSCRVSDAEFLEEDAPRLEQWLNKGYQGSMSYMENHFDKRLDPQKPEEMFIKYWTTSFIMKKFSSNHYI